ncbi:hypothetical protein PV10_05154 [Exophiala mesophila]|uniref:OTU domain-containing protein n=1 Tax=Exophiala mesophila TaxID=212818 RepID=A0A0D1ZH87_EXOME|nr:uncharacterized protein PV10_05154 [Exophiala mesophila]KIV93987.1 hypothetical protein PV10_05154 [Exophiala mesophila]
MADHAVHVQLPSMVRKPRAVWPGLARMGMYQKQIAGDGNCLFASLSDQLYGNPEKHPQIRASVVEHMRNFRPLFEHYVHKDDVQQRRTLRSTTASSRQESDDAFEEYLSLMSRGGTYGGEPELVAFCQVYNQDVTVHLPRIQNFDRDSIPYTNPYRDGPPSTLPLHICYGGDEVTRAHYDSARSRDGSIPRGRDSPLLKPIDISDSTPISSPIPSPGHLLSTRSIRNSRSEISSELIHDLIQKSKRDIDTNTDHSADKARARSPSVTSSQHSSSSKRSLDDDGDQTRSNKRADRRKSTRRRVDMVVLTPDLDNDSEHRPFDESSYADHSPSTQDSSAESTGPENGRLSTRIRSYTLEDEEDQVDGSRKTANVPHRSQNRSSLHIVTNLSVPGHPPSPRMISVAERPKSTLRA